MLLTISYSDRLTRLTYENLWKNTFLCKLYICYFIRLQNKNSYYVLFILVFGIGLPDYPMTIFGNTFKCKLFIVCFLFGNNNKKWEYVVDNIIFGTSCPINLWKYLKTHLNVNYLCDYILIVNYNKSENMLLTISYSDRLTWLTYENLWKHISI